MRPAQPPMPNRRTAEPIASDTASAVGSSDGYSAEANSASRHASLTSGQSSGRTASVGAGPDDLTSSVP
jgi:hypothetical protein